MKIDEYVGKALDDWKWAVEYDFVDEPTKGHTEDSNLALEIYDKLEWTKRNTYKMPLGNIEYQPVCRGTKSRNSKEYPVYYPTKRIYADVMNSFNTAFNLCISNKVGRKITNKNNRIWKQKIISDKRTYRSINHTFREYLSYYHSLGNFIPVPAGFNAGRYGTTNDCWDKTLGFIYEWFLDRRDYPVFLSETRIRKFLYCPREDANKYCSDWLSKFKSFNEFVDYYYLWDYVEHNEKDNSKYVVKKLWTRNLSSRSNHIISDKERSEICKTVNAISQIIARRGAFMVHLLLGDADTTDARNVYGKADFEEWLLLNNH